MAGKMVTTAKEKKIMEMRKLLDCKVDRCASNADSDISCAQCHAETLYKAGYRKRK